jgi:hypothetical protein
LESLLKVGIFEVINIRLKKLPDAKILNSAKEEIRQILSVKNVK